jgi:RNA polymerase sigma-B factor
MPASQREPDSGPDAPLDRDALEMAGGLLAELADLPAWDPRRPLLREQVIHQCLPIAAREARRYRHGPEPWDDLYQVAVLGLILAVDRYDPGKDVAFRYFAVPTITGELKRHFRDRTWTVRVSRRMQELSLLIRCCEPDLAQRLGRQPTACDIAAELRLTRADVNESRVAAAAHTAVSLDAPLFADGKAKALGDMLGTPDAALESLADRDALRRSLSVLPAEMRELLRLRFIDELTQQEIADKTGTSQMQVSRLLSRSIGVLRQHMLADQPA